MPLVLVALLLAATAAPPLWGPLEPGPHAVGFRVLHVDGRPALDVAVWYPAGSGGEALRYRDYLVADVPAARRDAVVGELGGLLAAKKVEPSTLLDAAVFARRDAPPAPGSSDVVLVAQGNGQWAADQAVLAEFLASHGFVVATVPSVVNLTGPMSTGADVTAKIEEETSHLERALSAVRASRTTSGRVAVVGHSFGARAALLYAMRHPTTAVVSLDGGIGTATAAEETRAARGFDARRPLRIAHVYEDVDESMKPDFTLLGALQAATVRRVRVTGPRHWHFTSLGFAALLVPAVAEASGAGPGLPHALATIAQETLAALR